MRRKIRQYFAAGCKLVLLFYPETKEVEVWESAAGPKIILGVSRARMIDCHQIGRP